MRPYAATSALEAACPHVVAQTINPNSSTQHFIAVTSTFRLNHHTRARRGCDQGSGYHFVTCAELDFACPLPASGAFAAHPEASAVEDKPPRTEHDSRR